MRILVCGDRNWKDKHAIEREIKGLLAVTIETDYDGYGEFVLIEGEAPGADSIAREIVESITQNTPFAVTVLPFPADWTLGLKAGPIRNQRMLDEGKPNIVLAFHKDIKHSKGTIDMIDKALKAGIPVRLFGA